MKVIKLDDLPPRLQQEVLDKSGCGELPACSTVSAVINEDPSQSASASSATAPTQEEGIMGANDLSTKATQESKKTKKSPLTRQTRAKSDGIKKKKASRPRQNKSN